jgi:hypothetical protein
MVKTTKRGRGKTPQTRGINESRRRPRDRPGPQKEPSPIEREILARLDEHVGKVDEATRDELKTTCRLGYEKLNRLILRHQTRPIEWAAVVWLIVCSAKQLYHDTVYRDNLVACINNASNAASLLRKLHFQIEMVNSEYLEASVDKVVDSMSSSEKKCNYSPLCGGLTRVSRVEIFQAS